MWIGGSFRVLARRPFYPPIILAGWRVRDKVFILFTLIEAEDVSSIGGVTLWSCLICESMLNIYYE